MSYEPKDATLATVTANHEAVERFDMENRQDYEDAERGLIVRIPGEKVVRDDGAVTLDLGVFGFLADDVPAPDTVHPSLWRQSQLIRKDGLFKLTDHLYQVRNNDIANVALNRPRFDAASF